MTSTADTTAKDGIAVTVAQIATEQCWADPSALARNTAKLEQWYGQAADDADLVVFPELVLTGYIPLKGYDQKRKQTLSVVANQVVDHALPKLVAATHDRRAAMVVGFMEPSTMRHERGRPASSSPEDPEGSTASTMAPASGWPAPSTTIPLSVLPVASRRVTSSRALPFSSRDVEVERLTPPVIIQASSV